MSLWAATLVWTQVLMAQAATTRVEGGEGYFGARKKGNNVRSCDNILRSRIEEPWLRRGTKRREL